MKDSKYKKSVFNGKISPLKPATILIQGHYTRYNSSFIKII